MANKPGYWNSLHGLTTIVLIVAALYFLLVEHGAHVFPYLPFLIILLCPLMHIFMHKGHGHGKTGNGEHQHQDAQELATQWQWQYNNERPNTSIGGVPPRWLLQAA